MAESEVRPSSPSGAARALRKAAPVIVVGSVMFSFISYWRVAAVVLCDMSSTVYYIGAIVESAIGKAAPWFILAVLLFSYGMRSVYIESCGLFVRGGVYKVVKEAMGGFLAKLSVSALMFDYVLTGPISGVSAGQYIVGLGLEALARLGGIEFEEGTRQAIKSWGSVLIACATTIYFFRQNLLGIPESSDKAVKIMAATTVMGIIMLIWCGVTLAVRGPVNHEIPWEPDLTKKVEIDAAGETVPKINPITGEQEDPLGFLGHYPAVAEPLRHPGSWLSLIGVVGLVLAFGHSILAMSGEETLAQVYREVESPKLPNFKKAAFVVFLYSFLLTGTMNILAVLLIPDQLRMKEYYDNWMGGLAMQMLGPPTVLLLLNAFVVVVGFLILSGAVNTSILGSNGVLSRVAEDGVLPDWFLKPHRRYGTTSRILYLITGLQLFTIVASQGDVILLGEAYAFGVVWSFVFKTLSMVVLRFKDRTPREFMVPFNVRVGGVELPIGLGVIFLIVFLSALANFVTKPVATISGLVFTAAFLVVFMTTERYYERRRRGVKHEHLEQFNRQTTQEVSVDSLRLEKPWHKLVAIRSPQNLFMLEKALAETDPDSTDLVVMTAKTMPVAGEEETGHFDNYDQKLLTAVVERAERAGKKVTPLIVPTNNPLYAVMNTARALGVQELVVGASNKFTTEEQLDQMAFYWINLNAGEAAPLTIRVLSREWDFYYDIGGGNRIPRISERGARTVAELRAAGVGVRRVLMHHENTPRSHDLFDTVLTALDPDVVLDVVTTGTSGGPNGGSNGGTGPTPNFLLQDVEQAEKIGRDVAVHSIDLDVGPAIVRLAIERDYDLIVLDSPLAAGAAHLPAWQQYVFEHAACAVCPISLPGIQREVVDSTPSTTIAVPREKSHAK
jgi:amino acid transporter/nucleotide-binding universal stress UspA family protein